MSKDLRDYIPLGRRGDPARQATFNLREENHIRLDDIADDYGAPKSGIINALIAKFFADNYDEAEDDGDS